MKYEYTESAAKAMFETLCSALDHWELKYDRDDEDLAAVFRVNKVMNFVILVDKSIPLVTFCSPLPVTFPEDKRVEGAIAVAVANFGYTSGYFQYDIEDGSVIFKLPQCFTDSTIGDECFREMISCAFATVDNYSDSFLALAKGVMSLQDFMAREKK